MNGTTRDFLSLWSAFLDAPRRVGAIVPSSSALARRMVEDVAWESVRTAVECGPGTGAFTGAILDRLPDAARLLAVELNPALAARLQERHPEVRVHSGSIAALPEILREHDLGPVDVIVSGLPWAAFSAEEQEVLLSRLISCLAPGGRFLTYAYIQGLLLPSGRRFRRLLHRNFPQVRRSPVVWRNIPPAFVYRCRR
ncbi:MAG: methyltransferase domain-containing protein [Acidobacteriota bacterium]|jgi:phospholipid N-methyltransferase